MMTLAETKSAPDPREQSAEAVYLAMSRFPLIVRVLGELSGSSVPLSGDNDLHHGCKRALTSMLAQLSRIQPAPGGAPSKYEDIVLGWLHDRTAEKLIDADQLERFQQLIERVLGCHATNN